MCRKSIKKVQKKCRGNTGNTQKVPEKCRKSTETIKKVQKYENKTGGRRRHPPPLWGGRRPPSYFWYFFCIFGSGFVFFLYFRTHLPIFSVFFSVSVPSLRALPVSGPVFLPLFSGWPFAVFFRYFSCILIVFALFRPVTGS